MNDGGRDTVAVRLASALVRVAFLAALLLAWFLATRVGGVSHILLPDPVNVWRQLVNIVGSGEFIPDLRVTLEEVAIAFAVAVAGGVTLGYFVGRSQYLTRAFEPLLAAIYAIPIILFLPLYVLFFGLGPASKIALGASIGFFPVVLSTIAGFANVDRALVTAARSMGASDVHMFRHVLLPTALPLVLGGLRIGFSATLLSVIASETIASLAGLGHRIVDLGENMDMARMFAYIVFVVAIVGALNLALSRLEARWR